MKELEKDILGIDLEEMRKETQEMVYLCKSIFHKYQNESKILSYRGKYSFILRLIITNIAEKFEEGEFDVNRKNNAAEKTKDDSFFGSSNKDNGDE